MIPLTLFCVLNCASNIPLIVGDRPLPNAIIDEFVRQNPTKETNRPACYIEGDFFKSCPR